MTQQKEEAAMPMDDDKKILSRLPRSFQILAKFVLEGSEKDAGST